MRSACITTSPGPPGRLRKISDAGARWGHKFCWTAARTLGPVRFEPGGLLHLLQSRPHTLEHIYRIWSQQARSLAAGSLLASMWSESRPVVRSAVL